MIPNKDLDDITYLGYKILITKNYDEINSNLNNTKTNLQLQIDDLKSRMIAIEQALEDEDY